jgi:hypothetical protein
LHLLEKFPIEADCTLATLYNTVLVQRNCLSFLLLDCIHLSKGVRVEKRGAYLDSRYRLRWLSGLLNEI